MDVHLYFAGDYSPPMMNRISHGKPWLAFEIHKFKELFENVDIAIKSASTLDENGNGIVRLTARNAADFNIMLNEVEDWLEDGQWHYVYMVLEDEEERHEFLNKYEQYSMMEETEEEYSPVDIGSIENNGNEYFPQGFDYSKTATVARAAEGGGSMSWNALFNGIYNMFG